MSVQHRPVRLSFSSPTTSLPTCQFANVSVRQRRVRERVSSLPVVSLISSSPKCQFANDQFANVSFRHQPVCQLLVRQRVSSPTTSSLTSQFANVSVRQRPIRQRISSPTNSSPTYTCIISLTTTPATTSSSTCQFRLEQLTYFRGKRHWELDGMRFKAEKVFWRERYFEG